MHTRALHALALAVDDAHTAPSGAGAVVEEPDQGRFCLVHPQTVQVERALGFDHAALQIAEQATVEGVWDLRRDGLQKVLDGVKGLEEINGVTID